MCPIERGATILDMRSQTSFGGRDTAEVEMTKMGHGSDRPQPPILSLPSLCISAMDGVRERLCDTNECAGCGQGSGRTHPRSPRHCGWIYGSSSPISTRLQGAMFALNLWKDAGNPIPMQQYLRPQQLERKSISAQSRCERIAGSALSALMSVSMIPSFQG